MRARASRGGHHCLTLVFREIRKAQFREAVAEGVAGETEGTGGLALVAARAAQGFADGLVFPLFERHAGRQDMRRAGNGARFEVQRAQTGMFPP